MHVTFRRTGERRYSVIVEAPDRGKQVFDPAPGYDHDIPHDLVHYVVEAELRLSSGVFGRAAQGGGTFVLAPQPGATARERARQQRKQRKRERSLDARDQSQSCDAITSERLAGWSDLAWRRRNGQRPDPSLWKSPEALTPDDAIRVERVLARLDELAALWRRLPVGGELVFEWPQLQPRLASAPRGSNSVEG